MKLVSNLFSVYIIYYKMCSIGDNWLKDVNYLDVRKKDLKDLTNSYIRFQDRLLELENKFFFHLKLHHPN